MNISRFTFVGIAVGIAMSLSPAAAATITFTTSSGVQPANAGVITLTQLTDAVNVKLDLLPGYGIINSGGPHTPFAFNLASETGVTVTFNTPPGGTYTYGNFSLNLAGGGATPFGDFGVAIDSSANNGSAKGYYGDLDFTVFKTGLKLQDFIANAGGWVFGADLSDGRNTGSQAWKNGELCETCGDPGNPPPSVPEPESLALFLGGLGIIGLRRRRKKA